METKITHFMGNELDEDGKIKGAYPEIIQPSPFEYIINNLNELQEKRFVVELGRLNIDRDVLMKQVKEITRLNFVIQQKEEQIEKMKNCQNCKHYDGCGLDNIQCSECLNGLDKWELAE